MHAASCVRGARERPEACSTTPRRTPSPPRASRPRFDPPTASAHTCPTDHAHLEQPKLRRPASVRWPPAQCLGGHAPPKQTSRRVVATPTCQFQKSTARNVRSGLHLNDGLMRPQNFLVERLVSHSLQDVSPKNFRSRRCTLRSVLHPCLLSNG